MSANVQRTYDISSLMVKWYTYISVHLYPCLKGSNWHWWFRHARRGFFFCFIFWMGSNFLFIFLASIAIFEKEHRLHKNYTILCQRFFVIFIWRDSRQIIAAQRSICSYTVENRLFKNVITQNKLRRKMKREKS